MYLPESEAIANSQPELATLIRQIDAHLSTADPAAVLRTSDYASLIGADHNQVLSVFELLERHGAITSEKMVECEICQNLMPEEEWHQSVKDEDTFQCTSCGRDFGLDAIHVTVYRPTHTALVESASNKMVSANRIATDEPDTEELSTAYLDNVFQNSPLLHYYSNGRELLHAKPFAGKRVFLVLHFLRDLLPFVQAMQRLGLDPRNATFFYKDYPYPQKSAVEQWLRKQGYRVLPRSDIDPTLDQLVRSDPAVIGKMLLIEDGGFFVPLIHRKYPKLISNVIGAVEQTTRGIMNCQSWLSEDVNHKLGFPVLSVATCALKGTFEPKYIGRAVLQNIETLSGVNLTGKKLAVLGYGTIGQQIVADARYRGVEVEVYVPDPTHNLAAQQAGIRRANTAAEAVANATVVIGSSGMQSIGSAEIARLAHRTMLVSASSELYEIDVDEISRQSHSSEPLMNVEGKVYGTRYVLPPNDRQVDLLANGYPINFWGMNSMPDQAADLILSLILLAAIELARGTFTDPGIDNGAINQLAGNYEVAKRFLELQEP